MTYYIYHIPNVKIGCSTNPKHRVKKQGYSSFKILETHDCIDSASVREQELQKQYGYKVDTVPYKSVYFQRKSMRTKENIMKGVEASLLVNCKPILQYDLQGNFIKEFKSIRYASRCGFKNINLAIKNKNFTGSGYMWRYKKNKIPLKIKPHIPTKTICKWRKKTLQYDLDGNFIKKWDSALQAQTELSIFHVDRVCRGERKSAGGYKWKYKD